MASKRKSVKNLMNTNDVAEAKKPKQSTISEQPIVLEKTEISLEGKELNKRDEFNGSKEAVVSKKHNLSMDPEVPREFKVSEAIQEFMDSLDPTSLSLFKRLRKPVPVKVCMESLKPAEPIKLKRAKKLNESKERNEPDKFIELVDLSASAKKEVAKQSVLNLLTDKEVTKKKPVELESIGKETMANTVFKKETFAEQSAKQYYQPIEEAAIKTSLVEIESVGEEPIINKDFKEETDDEEYDHSTEMEAIKKRLAELESMEKEAIANKVFIEETDDEEYYQSTEKESIDNKVCKKETDDEDYYLSTEIEAIKKRLAELESMGEEAIINKIFKNETDDEEYYQSTEMEAIKKRLGEPESSEEEAIVNKVFIKETGEKSSGEKQLVKNKAAEKKVLEINGSKMEYIKDESIENQPVEKKADKKKLVEDVADKQKLLQKMVVQNNTAKKTTVEEADSEKSDEKKANEEEADGEKADGEKADGEKADGEKADGEKADGEKADGEKADGEEAAGEKADGEKADEEETNKKEANKEKPVEKKPVKKEPLRDNWIWWLREEKRFTTYKEKLREIISFKTVEDFWYVFNYLKLPSQMKGDCDYSVFKTGLGPLWDDPNHDKAGRWVIKFDKKSIVDLDIIWERLLVLCIRGRLPHYDRISGVYVNIRSKFNSISLWHKNNTPTKDLLSIGKAIKKHFNLGVRVLCYYYHHQCKRREWGLPSLVL